MKTSEDASDASVLSAARIQLKARAEAGAYRALADSLRLRMVSSPAPTEDALTW